MTELERLDALSKERQLTETESLLLEREIIIEQGARIPYGLSKALARRGIKRNMSLYAQRAIKANNAQS